MASLDFFGPILPDACNCAHQVTANGVSVASSAPAWGCVLQIIQNLQNMFLSLAVLLITFYIAYAGITYLMSPTNEEKRTQARQRIVNAVIGIVIVLCAWLLVDSIMKVLYDGSGQNKTGFGPWNSILSSSDASMDCLAPSPNADLPGIITTPGQPSSNAGGGTAPTGVTVVTPATTATGDEAGVRAQFTAAGVAINHAACPANSTGQGCTNVGGMQGATVQQIIALNGICGGKCGITVTGGSEPGHAKGTYSHGNGYKVDLRLGTPIDGIIAQQKYYVGQRTGDHPGPGYTDNCGQNQYVKESDHWDATIKAYCASPF